MAQKASFQDITTVAVSIIRVLYPGLGGSASAREEEKSARMHTGNSA